MTEMSDQDQVRELMRDDLPADYVLNSVYEIENAIRVCEAMMKKVSFFKDLKKFRAQSIDKELRILEDKMSFMRSVILRTMLQLDPTQRTFQFPSVGKVTRRKGRATWKIEDQDAVLDYLESKGVKDQVVETKESVNMRALKKLLDDLGKTESVPGAVLSESDESISLTYETLKSDEIAADNKPDLLDLDTLSIDDV